MQKKLFKKVSCAFVSGPAVGTFLYLSGGFAFPFFLLGTLAAVLFVAAACVLPQVEDGVSNVVRGLKN